MSTEILIKNNEKVFFQYKIAVELKNQISIFDVNAANLSERELKNAAVKRAFYALASEEEYIEFYNRKQQLFVKLFQVISDRILVFQLAVKKSIDTTVKEDTFVEKKQEDYPYSLVIFDNKTQSLYVERNYKVFTDPVSVVNILVNFFRVLNSHIDENSFTKFNINIITSPEDFLECYDTFDIVNKITLKFDTPNSFLGSKKADEFLNEIRNETQAKKATIEFASDSGIEGGGFYKYFTEFFKYITHGGGLWTMRGKKKDSAKSITVKSVNKVKTININVILNQNNTQIDNSEQIQNIISQENNYEE